MRIAHWLLLGIFAVAACAAPHAETPPSQLSEEWTEITPPPIEIDGELFTPTCSGAPGADPAFRFWAKRGRGDGLVVFFDGGGACWDNATCLRAGLRDTPRDANWLYKAELLPTDDPRRLQGIFDLSNPENPLRDWSFVFVPYCTGDVHSGSNTITYTNPDTHQPYPIHHRGSDNFQAVLAWMRAHVDAPDRILVTGSSAGAYGAATHFARIREAFPSGSAVMLGDAGQGVSTPGFVTERNRNWSYDLPRSVFGEGRAEGVDIVGALAAHYPNDRFAQYTTAHDRVQVGFFALMGAQGACTAWTETMSQALAQRDRASNFHAYLAAGETHTILRSPLFYTETSGGEPFADWLAALVNGDSGRSRTCVNCLAPPAQCEHER